VTLGRDDTVFAQCLERAADVHGGQAERIGDVLLGEREIAQSIVRRADGARMQVEK
jgi:hypothetical protein